MSSTIQNPVDHPGESDHPAAIDRSDENEAVRDSTNMRTSRFDRVSGLFLTLVLFLGVIVSALFLLWTLNRWANQEEIHHSRPTRTSFVQGDGQTVASDFVTPSPSEFQALREPSLNATLVAVTDAANEAVAQLDALTGVDHSSNRRSGPSQHGSFLQEAGSVDIIPRFNRWQLNFTATGVQPYAAQLDYFGIELGVVGGSIQGLDVVSDLSTVVRTRRIVDTGQEQRLYFMWTSESPLKSFESTLIRSAGVELKDRQMIQIIPEELEQALASIEMRYAEKTGHTSVSEIAQTTFRCVSIDQGFEFRVVDQRYRTNN